MQSEQQHVLNAGIFRIQTNNLQIQGNYVTIGIVKIVLGQCFTMLIVMGENAGRFSGKTKKCPQECMSDLQ